MSAKGNCYDNACAESFFHSLKVEAIHGERFDTRETMRQTVFESIETDYLCPRVQSRQATLNQWLFKSEPLAKLSPVKQAEVIIRH
jgi:transposase InsO family protein